MGSGSAFDRIRQRAPEQEKKKGFGLKLPKIGMPKIGFKKILFWGTVGTAFGAYTLGNTYSVGPDEAVYSINTVRSAANRVRVYQGSGIDLPITQTNLHLPWPLGGKDAPGGWPIGAHAIVPLADTFKGTVENTMYKQFIEELTYSVDQKDVEAHVLEFGRYAMATTGIERAVEGDDFSLTGFAEAFREDGEEVEGASEALLDRIYDVISYVQSGKSVEEMDAMKDNPVFIAYLIHEIEEMIPTINIETLVLGNVTRQPNVITVTTADSVPVDLQILYGGTKYGWNSTLDEQEEEIVKAIFANHYLMELGSSGELPAQIHEELSMALGIDLEDLTSLAKYERFERMSMEETLSGYSSWNANTKALVVNLGNAQDQFYRKSFDSGLLAFGVSVADERMATGDIEGAIQMLLGIVEHAYMHPLNAEAQAYVADSMLDLGWLYEGLATTAYIQRDYETSQEYAQSAGTFFLDFLRYAPTGHPEVDNIGDHLHSKYGDMFDWDTLERLDDAVLDLDKYSTGTSAPAPVEEEAVPVEEEATPVEGEETVPPAEGEGEGE